MTQPEKKPKHEDDMTAQMLSLDIIQAQLEQEEALMTLRSKEYELQQKRVQRLKEMSDKLKGSIKKAING